MSTVLIGFHTFQLLKVHLSRQLVAGPLTETLVSLSFCANENKRKTCLIHASNHASLSSAHSRYPRPLNERQCASSVSRINNPQTGAHPTVTMCNSGLEPISCLSCSCHSSSQISQVTGTADNPLMFYLGLPGTTNCVYHTVGFFCSSAEVSHSNLMFQKNLMVQIDCQKFPAVLEPPL